MVFVIIPYNSFATTACVEDNTVAVVLDPHIVPHSYYGRAGDNKWSMTASYGTLSGISACLESNHDVAMDTTYKVNNGILIEKDKVVVGGERNGAWCWCKITYPVVSYWWRRGQYQSLNECILYCGYENCNYFMFMNFDGCDPSHQENNRIRIFSSFQ